MEEELREAACNGDLESVRRLVSQGTNVNAQHSMNGWTALHWAAKRGQVSIVRHLIASGADITRTNEKSQVPVDLTTNPEIKELLGGDPDTITNESSENDGLNFTPNYLANPPFPYLKPSAQAVAPHVEPAAFTTSPASAVVQNDVRAQGDASMTPQETSMTTKTSGMTVQASGIEGNEIVLKARIANAAEMDFYEIELSRDAMTHAQLLALMCRELGVRPELVFKIRKLPNTVVRKDRDVARLQPWTELELVLSHKYVSESSRNYKPAVQPREEDIVY